jgi:iron complex transport system substrate-binding protein
MFLRLLILVLLAGQARADIAVPDETGAQVRLAGPARRIVSLAPHVTENLYAAGAGARLVGAVDYSDYPEAALRLPRVGSYHQPDLEAIVALKPDLVVAWQSGTPPAAVHKLKTLGLAVYMTQPNRLEDIPTGIERLGRLAGTEAVAARTAADFRARLGQLRTRHAGRPPVPVFYQVWHRPLMTVGGGQIISDLIRQCGGDNVFAELPGLATAVSHEAVLAIDPEAIVASGMGLGDPVGLDDWRRWPKLIATRRNNLFFVPADLMQRPTPRLLDGMARMCEHLETARNRR